MPRREPAYRELHAAADRIEPRLERAFVRAMERLRDQVSINELALALSAGDAKGALRRVPVGEVREALEGVGDSVQEAFMRGGRLGAKRINEL